MMNDQRDKHDDDAAKAKPMHDPGEIPKFFGFAEQGPTTVEPFGPGGAGRFPSIEAV